MFPSLTAELRTRSQQERKCVFWAIALSETIDRETVELFRSKEILARKEREAKGEEAPTLVAEERIRLRRHGDELSNPAATRTPGNDVDDRGLCFLPLSSTDYPGGTRAVTRWNDGGRAVARASLSRRRGRDPDVGRGNLARPRTSETRATRYFVCRSTGSSRSTGVGFPSRSSMTR